jgi:chorismate mutase
LPVGWSSVLARYFFNFLDGRNVRDDVGSEHESIASVREEAVEVLTDILKDRILQEEDMSSVMIQVTNEQNVTVLVISLMAAVRVIEDLTPILAA